MILFLLSCTLQKTIHLDSAEPECSSLNYSNFAAAFMVQYCLGCHASSANNREGAPLDISLESIENIAEYQEAILREIAEETMPPQGGIAAETRQTAIEWLNCIMETGEEE